MVSYKKKLYFINVHISWFGYKYNLWDFFSFNAGMHVKNNQNKKVPGIRADTHTLELDLTQDTESIFAGFAKQIRQQYKISENEGITTYFHSDIDGFVHFFNNFASRKNTFTTSRRRIEEMGDNLKLAYAEHNGEILAAHSYLADEDTGVVRHMHSATKRLDDMTDKNLVGRANKYLTVKDILYFKENGFTTFDFGGYAAETKDESLQGINKFKLLFGGKLVGCKNYYSLPYWASKKIVNSLGLHSEV